LFFLSPVPAHAQTIEWVRQFGTDRGDKALAVAKGPSGVYVAGQTAGLFAGETTVSVGDNEAFLSRYDEQGTALWTREFGSSTLGDDSATGVTTDQTGVYVVGTVQNALLGQTSQGSTDAFIRKYTVDGVLLWTRQFGTNAQDEALGVTSDGTGVYVVGDTHGNIVTGQPVPEGEDAFIRRYDANGNVVWTRQFGTADFDNANGVATDGTGIYVVGTTGGDLAGAFGGFRDGFLRKYDSGGNVLWTRQFGTDGPDDAYAVAAGGLGVFVAGQTYGTFPGQTKLTPGLYDAYLIKYDASGTQQWVREFGTIREDWAYGLAVGAASVVVVGFAEDNILAPAPSTGIGALIRLYDPDGSVQGTIQFGDGVNDISYAVAADVTGAYVVGTKTGTALGQVSLGPGQDAFVMKVTLPAPTSLPFTITNNTGISTTTDGTGDLSAGHASIEPTTGSTAPSGVAIFGYSSGGVLVSEAGVPDSPLITSGRIYVEVSAPTAVVNTGLAIANPSAQAVTITFVLVDVAGAVVKTGSRSINPRSQVAEFLTEAPYLSGNGFQGTLTFTSTVPVGVIALRSFANERNDFLITTLPVIDLSLAASLGTQVIPHFAVGDGWTTQILLINPTDTAQTGTVQFFGPGSGSTAGAAVTVSVDGASGTTVAYTIPGRSSRRLVVTPAASGLTYGSVRIIPANSGPAPTPLVIFGYKPGPFTLSEAGVPVISGTAFRMYVEASAAPVILSGIAASNNTNAAVTATLELATLAGVPVGISTTRTIPANGQIVGYLSDFFPNLPQPFKGILRLSISSGSVSVVALRQRYNERGDYLITTTPPSIENRAPIAAARSFPHIVNGGGYTTQFVLFSGTAGQSTGGSMKFYRQNGTPMPVSLR
jgi:hypothetical protein